MLPDDANGPGNVWKAQDAKEQAGTIKIDPAELAALARSRQKLNAFVHWTAATAMGSLAAGFLYHVWSADQPWIRFGQAWAIGFLAYVFGAEFNFGEGRKGVSEPCVRFLERQHEERARGYLRMRSRLWLLLPSIVASWLGGGPMAAVKARGLDSSSWLFRFCAGPWLFVVVGAALILVWLAFGGAAAKAQRDLEELRRNVAR